MTAAAAIIVFLSDGRQIDITGKTADEGVAEIRATIGTATILRTEHRIAARVAGDAVTCPTCRARLVLVSNRGLWACDPGTKRRHRCLRDR